MFRELLGRYFTQEFGLTVVATAASVQEGLTVLRSAKPDLAVVDWKLPDGHGFDLIRPLKSELPATLWLLLSANMQGHVVREALQLGVSGFVQKQADLDSLRKAVKRIMAGENYYCPASSSVLVGRLVDEVRDRHNIPTTRERDILLGYARGQNIKVTAAHLGISIKTAQNHLTNLKEKLGLHEPAHLIGYAVKHGYLELP